MRARAASFFDSFESCCQTTLNKSTFATYCEPVRKTLEHMTELCMNTTLVFYANAKWSFETTGKHYGKAGQCLLILLVAGIAYNLLVSHRKGEKKT